MFDLKHVQTVSSVEHLEYFDDPKVIAADCCGLLLFGTAAVIGAVIAAVAVIAADQSTARDHLCSISAAHDHLCIISKHIAQMVILLL